MPPFFALCDSAPMHTVIQPARRKSRTRPRHMLIRSNQIGGPSSAGDVIRLTTRQVAISIMAVVIFRRIGRQNRLSFGACMDVRADATNSMKPSCRATPPSPVVVSVNQGSAWMPGANASSFGVAEVGFMKISPAHPKAEWILLTSNLKTVL
jgi:hypothetical protein